MSGNTNELTDQDLADLLDDVPRKHYIDFEGKRISTITGGYIDGDDDGNDPAILPLEDATPGELPIDVLPWWSKNHCMAIAAAKEVPITLPFLLTLSATATCVQGQYVVQVEQAHCEHLALFCAPAMESGERKTSVYNLVYRPLFDYQRELREQAKAEVQAESIRRNLIKDKIKRLEKDYQTAEGDEAEAIEQRIIEETTKLPPERSAPQLVADDFTPAAMEVALASNGERMGVGSDEGGLFDNLGGRHNAVSELDLVLKGHVGSPHESNRTGRANVSLARPLLSIGITPQPAVIAKLGRMPGFIERGFTARFLFGLPESRVGKRDLNPAHIDGDTLEEYRRHMRQLAEAGRRHAGEPTPLRLSGEAYRLWKAFEREIEPRMAKDGDLYAVKPWASKLPGAVARIAGICHAADHMENAGVMEIDGQRMQDAIALGLALVPHAVAVHRLMGTGGASVAQEVVNYYQANGWPREPKALTDWWRPVRKLVGETSRDFQPVADILVDHGYLVPCDPPEGRKGGPKSQWHRANHQLFRKSECP